ncbi:hypothetical protein B0O99DRAFT_697596 [Bisporella sp. PMI_857]|nr:hypothetical protein B0O99DRAFT_697596 [Bisporella sp. PMI_857]
MDVEEQGEASAGDGGVSLNLQEQMGQKKSKQPKGSPEPDTITKKNKPGMQGSEVDISADLNSGEVARSRKVKKCIYFCGGHVCRKGQHCIYVHDERARAKAIRHLEERVLNSKAIDEAAFEDGFEPYYAVLVSGYGGRYILKVKQIFAQFSPVRFEWASQFSATHREALMTRHELPEEFVRISFARAEDQHNAIIRRNGKNISPLRTRNYVRLLVQAYFQGSAEENKEFEADDEIRNSGAVGDKIGDGSDGGQISEREDLYNDLLERLS